jgi:hypothetical protein
MLPRLPILFRLITTDVLLLWFSTGNRVRMDDLSLVVTLLIWGCKFIDTVEIIVPSVPARVRTPVGLFTMLSFVVYATSVYLPAMIGQHEAIMTATLGADVIITNST